MSVPISGILLDPYGNVARFADIKFVTVQGTLDVIESSSAVFRTDENGAYSINVQFGRFAVLMRFNGNNGAYDKIQTISVNSDTVASTLGELLAYTEPLTPAEILLVQQLVAQAIAAKDDAEAAALQAAIEAANAAASAAAALASEIAAANSVALLAPVPLNGGVWASGQTFTAYNQYMIYNGEAYSPRQETVLPYVVGAIPDLGFVYQIKLNSLQALSGLTEPSDLDQVHTRVAQSINEAKTLTSAVDGMVVRIEDRPEAEFKYVLASSVTVDGYNIVQCVTPIANLALKRINYQITDLLAQSYFGSELSNLNVVVTGDSLSFNGYGYPAGWGVTGTGYATDQWFGLSSWSHLVRDFIVSSNPAFKSMFDLNWYSSGGVVGRGITVADERYFGMNGRVITFNFPNSTSKVIIETNSGLPIGLLVAAASEAFAYKFSVDGIEYDNVTDYPDNYLGGGYKVIPCGIEPVITNVRRFTTLAAGGEFGIYGITSSTAGGANAKYPMITGKGGYTSGQVLAEYNTLVKPYLPDVMFYMIGANDIDSGVPVATFKANIEQFVDLVRADSPNAKIILLTTTPIARPPWVEGQERPYIQAMQDVCDDKYCYLINVYDEFRNIDPFYWRIDNTHFKPRGDTMMFKLVKDKIMPALPINHRNFTPVRECYTGLNGIDGKREQLTNYIEVQCTAGNPTITAQQNGNFLQTCAAQYLSDGGYLIMRVTFPDGYLFSSAETMHTNPSNNLDVLKVRSANSNYVDIFRTIDGVSTAIEGSDNKIRLVAGRLFNQV